MSIGPRLSCLSLPWTRTIGGWPTFMCKSLPCSFTHARKYLSTSSSLSLGQEAILQVPHIDVVFVATGVKQLS